MRRDFLSVLLQLSVPFVFSAPAWAEPNAAHALAQKFAVEERRTPPVAKPHPKVAQAKPASPAPATQEDYEREMLDAAKAEAAQRQSADDAEAKAAGAPAAASAPAATQKKTVPSQVQIKIEAKIPAAAPAREANGSRASILVVLNQTGSGEIPKTFDPIICLGDVCYVSAGNGSNAKQIGKQDALTTKNSMASGAGACAGKPACTFRGVSIPDGANLQIVDLGIVRHDERELIAAKIDPTCTVEDGFLVCDKPTTAPDYRLWIVPEAIASKAGEDKIAAALDAELPEENVTLETDK